MENHLGFRVRKERRVREDSPSPQGSIGIGSETEGQQSVIQISDPWAEMSFS
jgi:hypothetical protein